MESASLTVERIHILRVDPGEDVLLAVERLLTEAGLRQAVVMGGYGTLAAHHLHWVVQSVEALTGFCYHKCIARLRPLLSRRRSRNHNE